ncbi:MAG: CidA/LrgA family protein [Gammaproteobacteria bacterium]|nr:CidA/LrgA family protein [Gammaproteobacteria bacterium]
MGFLSGLAILLVFQLLGEIVVILAALPVPGPVIGMILLFVFLTQSRQSKSYLNETSSHLLTHLSLLFIPAGVGVMVHMDKLGTEWIAIGTTLLLSTIITMLVTAISLIFFLRVFGAEKKHD